MPKNSNLNVLSILQEHGAFIKGHFQLPSGVHSEVYVQTSLAMQHPHIAHKLAKAMSDKFAKKCDAVIAPTPHTSIIAQEVARVRGARAIFAEIVDGVMSLGRNFEIKPGESVLIVDDVAVSGKQISQVCSLIKNAGAKVIGISVLVDRSMGYLPLNVPLRALVSYPLKTYSESECPLCAIKHPLTKK
ncbi:orotate phosphoribosyltransferase [Parelusimicrobium proximum]|uniref:phosphoribosyltransferase family protein n=1 Tax=Parelusimicrobium proximum TaxID=3228953 RepID=UPI003D16F35C